MELLKKYKLQDIKSISLTPPLKNDLSILWTLTKYCPYNCEYCIQKNGKVKQIEHTQEYLEQIANKIKNILNKAGNPNTKIVFIGGEPSIFNLSDIIEKLDCACIKKYSVVTNLFQKIDYYLNLEKYVNNLNKQISFSASLHKTQCNIDDFLNKVIHLKNCRPTLVVTTENYKDIIKLNEELKCKQVYCRLKTARGNDKIHSIEKLPDDIITYIEKHNNKYSTSKKIKVIYKNNVIKNYSDIGIFAKDLEEYKLNFSNFICSVNRINIIDNKIRVGTCDDWINYQSINIEDFDISSVAFTKICKSNRDCFLNDFKKIEG